METFQFCWLVDVEENVTIVDKATAWLANYKAEVPARARASMTNRKTRARSGGHGRLGRAFECFKGLVSSYANDADIDELQLEAVRWVSVLRRRARRVL